MLSYIIIIIFIINDDHNKDALLDLDGVGGGDALSDVALLRGLGAPKCQHSVESESDFALVCRESESGHLRGGDDLLATLSDGGILKHIHHSLADLICLNWKLM